MSSCFSEQFLDSFNRMSTLPPIDKEHFISVRTTEIVRQLGQEAGQFNISMDLFEQFSRLTGHLLHATFYDQLHHLKSHYHYFQPNLEIAPSLHSDTTPKARHRVLQELDKVMEKANFIVVSEDEMRSEAIEQHNFFRLKVAPPLGQLSYYRLYRRGISEQVMCKPRFFGLWQKSIKREVYGEVLLVAVTHDYDFFRKINQKRWFNRIAPIFRPGAILLKNFRNIPKGELRMLFPKIKILLSAWDKLTIAIPALFGAIPLIFRVLPSLIIMISSLAIADLVYKMIDAQTWTNLAQGKIDQEIQFLIAAISLIVTPLAFLMGQVLKIQHRFLHYRNQLIDNIYYRNISNNSLVFDYLINAAEEQELKEILLAYFFLLAHGPQSLQKLDQLIEKWIQTHFSINVDFEVDDGLNKLLRYNLVEALEDGRYAAKSLPDALIELNKTWNHLFQYVVQH